MGIRCAYSSVKSSGDVYNYLHVCRLFERNLNLVLDRIESIGGYRFLKTETWNRTAVARYFHEMFVCGVAGLNEKTDASQDGRS